MPVVHGGYTHGNSYKDPDCPSCKIEDLQSKLKEVTKQRDDFADAVRNWNKIAERNATDACAGTPDTCWCSTCQCARIKKEVKSIGDSLITSQTNVASLKNWMRVTIGLIKQCEGDGGCIVHQMLDEGQKLVGY
jgi:hypothetical protein